MEIECFDCVDLLVFVEEFKVCYQVFIVFGLLCFDGGLVGYFGYDCVCYVEKCLVICLNLDLLGNLDILLMVFDVVVVFDNLVGKIYVIVFVDFFEENVYECGQVCLEELLECLCQLIILCCGFDFEVVQGCELVFCVSFICEDYENVVGRIKDYILVGDCMQVVLLQCMFIEFKVVFIDLYCVLCCFNLMFYMYFFNFGDFYVVGSLLEVLVWVEDGLVMVCLIVGICLCGINEEVDLVLEQDLLLDVKEIVEYLMLIDLGCNDVGWVFDIGVVKVIEKMVIECYFNVMYIVFNVIG